MFKAEIEELIIQALKKVNLEIPDNFVVEKPDNKSFGDYSTNLALILGKKTSQNPCQLAETIISQIVKGELVETIEIAGPGFINFWLKKEILFKNYESILNNPDQFGKANIHQNKKILVEFAHPNTHKNFHIGHLRNIITGEAICRILEKNSAKVTRANYQGDVGLHIAKALWGLKQKELINSEDIHQKMKFVTDAYVAGNTAFEEGTADEEINQINQLLYEQNDPELTKLYQLTRTWSLEYLDGLYKRLDVKFDRLYFESEVARSGKEIALKALEKGILERSQGAVIFPGSKYGLHDRVFISQNNNPTYEAKELGLAELQIKENQPDKIFHVVAPEQTGYFEVVIAALAKIIPETEGKEIHQAYGWVRLKDGKMSSRKGNVILGEWLLNEAKRRIIEKYQISDEIAEQLAIGAVRYSFLKVGISQDIAFSINESISLQGNSGPYLQYTVARIYGLFRKVGIDPAGRDDPVGRLGSNNETTQRVVSIDGLNTLEINLLRQMVHYSETIAKSGQTIMPHYICDFLYQLAENYNKYYDQVKILDDNANVKNSRLLLSLAVARLLRSGLALLGIKAPEKL